MERRSGLTTSIHRLLNEVNAEFSPKTLKAVFHKNHPGSVTEALRTLTEEGSIVRQGRGSYVGANYTAPTTVTPSRGTEVLAETDSIVVLKTRGGDVLVATITDRA